MATILKLELNKVTVNDKVYTFETTTKALSEWQRIWKVRNFFEGRKYAIFPKDEVIIFRSNSTGACVILKMTGTNVLIHATNCQPITITQSYQNLCVNGGSYIFDGYDEARERWSTLWKARDFFLPEELKVITKTKAVLFVGIDTTIIVMMEKE